MDCPATKPVILVHNGTPYPTITGTYWLDRHVLTINVASFVGESAEDQLWYIEHALCKKYLRHDTMALFAHPHRGFFTRISLTDNYMIIAS